MTSDLQKMREKAENYYLAGDYHCSETVLKVILENFKTGLPEEILSLATGFPRGGGGAGCICGALAGGTMALGMIFGGSKAKEDDKKALELSHELHKIFKEKHKVACCRVLTKKVVHGSPEQRQQCARFSGEITEETARIIIREKGADILKHPR